VAGFHASGHGGKFNLRAEVHSGHVYLEVADEGGPWTRTAHGDDRPHGLELVEALAGPGNWGITGDASGRTAWARITI